MVQLSRHSNNEDFGEERYPMLSKFGALFKILHTWDRSVARSHSYPILMNKCYFLYSH